MILAKGTGVPVSWYSVTHKILTVHTNVKSHINTDYTYKCNPAVNGRIAFKLVGN